MCGGREKEGEGERGGECREGKRCLPVGVIAFIRYIYMTAFGSSNSAADCFSIEYFDIRLCV